MSKREVIRRMYEGAMDGERSESNAISYVARRLGLDTKQAIYFLNWMQRHEGIAYVLVGRMVVFVEAE